LDVFSPERSKVAARRAAATAAAAAALVLGPGRWMQMVIHQLVSNDLVVQHVELEPNETFKPHCDSEMMASNMQMCNKYAIRMHYAELRMHYAKLRIFYANHLRSNYAIITQKIRKYITQNTQRLRK